MKHIFTLKPYVVAKPKYLCHNLEINLDEPTKRVTVKRADVYGALIAGSSPLVDKTFPDLPSAITYYNNMILQLQQGDVIRNI